MLVELVTCPPAVPEPTESTLADEPVRTVSLIGLMHAEPDLAERSEEILRAEFGKHAG
ncbi:MAG TPA: hypothetical protein VFX70_15840 [Mycobacteriales bacterium]|nr:hypothetical protein [Mycobacteriales bacterium]